MLQDVAVAGSTHLGWPPDRYRREGSGFVVRRMTVEVLVQPQFGMRFQAETWLSAFRRGVFTDRSILLFCEGELVLRCHQAWVHVAFPQLRVARAPDSLIESFSPIERKTQALWTPRGAPSIVGDAMRMQLQIWQTWMDPLGHANHPAYLDWVDECICRALGTELSQGLVALGESVVFKKGVVAEQIVDIVVVPSQRTESGLVFEFEMECEGELMVSGWVHRGHLKGTDVLFGEVCSAKS